MSLCLQSRIWTAFIFHLRGLYIIDRARILAYYFNKNFCRGIYLLEQIINFFNLLDIIKFGNKFFYDGGFCTSQLLIGRLLRMKTRRLLVTINPKSVLLESSV